MQKIQLSVLDSNDTFRGDGERRVARVERSGDTPTDYFSYDVFGNVIAESNSVASVAHLRDNLGMDTNEVTTVGAESLSLERAYDDCRRLAVMRRGGGATAYAYAADGKLASISNADAFVEYAYAPDRRGLGYTLTLPDGGVFSRGLARHRYIRSDIERVVNSFNGVEVNSLSYTNDALGRPVSRNSDAFAYNARGELSSAVISSGLYTNAYDSIGNLTLSMATNVHRRWEANGLNQYTGIFSAGDWRLPSYDVDGNMLTNGAFSYSYDDAGRLASVMSNGVLLAANEYDAKSRRVRKITPEHTATYFYDGWNLVEERVAYTNGATETIEYFWGKDLSESLQGAGGVGGLLYVKRNGAVYIPCYDANGNITDYIDASGEVVASYTYDAFGGTISQSGALADTFAHRFSTKYLDAETGLYYYGYRFYSPELMRWLNRDPIEESGGLNLYAFCKNDPISKYDIHGLVFGITYVQFRGLLGHGWVRLGDKQTYNITEMFSSPIQHDGTLYTVINATAELPVGIGFYPAEEVTSGTSILTHPGEWRYEAEKEAYAVYSKEDLREWDTEIDKSNWFGLVSTKLQYGSSKGKCCKNATRNDIVGCLNAYKDSHPRQTYWLPFLNCRSRAKSALNACCLKVGKERGGADVGSIALSVVPIND